ncbi:hypothetical protein ACIRRH_31250 [Kitasatospora sp. NPDC101235]
MTDRLYSQRNEAAKPTWARTTARVVQQGSRIRRPTAGRRR